MIYSVRLLLRTVNHMSLFSLCMRCVIDEYHAKHEVVIQCKLVQLFYCYENISGLNKKIK
jgi:hypothetical protein